MDQFYRWQINGCFPTTSATMFFPTALQIIGRPNVVATIAQKLHIDVPQ